MSKKTNTKGEDGTDFTVLDENGTIRRPDLSHGPTRERPADYVNL